MIQYKVHIVYAITNETEAMLPINDIGTAGTSFSSATDVWPLLCFVIGLVSGSFGMSKYLLLAPIENKPIDNLCSIKFLGLIVLNTFFIVRLYSIENILFSYYQYYPNNLRNGSLDPFLIDPIIPLRYKHVRLIFYFLPAYVSILANLMRLKYTRANLKDIFMNSPQVFILPGFSPFIYEQATSSKIESNSTNQLQIWRSGSIANGVYIGLVPSIALITSEYLRDITTFEFDPTQQTAKTYANSSLNLLFCSSVANVVFASTYILVSGLVMITIYGQVNVLSCKTSLRTDQENEVTIKTRRIQMVDKDERTDKNKLINTAFTSCFLVNRRKDSVP